MFKRWGILEIDRSQPNKYNPVPSALRQSDWTDQRREHGRVLSACWGVCWRRYGTVGQTINRYLEKPWSNWAHELELLLQLCLFQIQGQKITVIEIFSTKGHMVLTRNRTRAKTCHLHNVRSAVARKMAEAGGKRSECQCGWTWTPPCCRYTGNVFSAHTERSAIGLASSNTLFNQVWHLSSFTLTDVTSNRPPFIFLLIHLFLGVWVHLFLSVFQRLGLFETNKRYQIRSQHHSPRTKRSGTSKRELLGGGRM